MPSNKKTQKKFPEPAPSRPRDLSEEPERGCVLCAHAWIEKLLGDRLTEYLLKSSSNDTNLVSSLIDADHSLLGAFANRARMARALGIVGDGTYHALTELNDLRNHFAHHSGPVRLMSMWVNRITGQFKKDAKEPHKLIGAVIDGDITSRPIPLQEFLAAVAGLRIALGDKTQLHFSRKDTKAILNALHIQKL